MNPDLTVPLGAVRSGFVLFATRASKVYIQKTRHTSIVANSGDKKRKKE